MSEPTPKEKKPYTVTKVLQEIQKGRWMPTTDAKGTLIAVGDVIQIDPEYDELFGSCLMVVSEVKSFGCQCFVRVPGSGDAYYRVPSEVFVLVGKAPWIAALTGERSNNGRKAV